MSMKDVGEFVANPFGLGDAGAGAVSYLADSLGFSNNKQIDAAKATLDDVLTRADSVGSQNRNLYGKYYDQMQGMYGEGAQAYTDAVKNLADAIENRQDFSYQGSVNDFLDPAREQRVQAATNAINNLGTLANIYQSDRNQLGNAIGDYYTAMANQNNADLEVYSDVIGNKANLEAQRQSGAGGLLQGIGSIIGAIF